MPYECNPMAFLAEHQAAVRPATVKSVFWILSRKAWHQRRSFFVGNNHMVEDVENFIKAFPDVGSPARLSAPAGGDPPPRSLASPPHFCRFFHSTVASRCSAIKINSKCRWRFSSTMS
ncbi:hypothetical protein MJ561_03295 [Klebsiella pneumoniae]|nr:hypothetical protein MJ561_03295 [Klebsiella pneumoniae]